MEFHGATNVIQMLFEQFHGILEKVPWNLLIKISFDERRKEILNDISIRNEYYRYLVCGITQTLIMKHKWVKQTYKKI